MTLIPLLTYFHLDLYCSILTISVFQDLKNHFDIHRKWKLTDLPLKSHRSIHLYNSIPVNFILINRSVFSSTAEFIVVTVHSFTL